MIQNPGQMAILWCFVLFQAIYGFLKYGPLFPSNKICAILTPEFSPDCNVYWIFPAQFATYFILFCLFFICTCDCYKKQKKKNDNLNDLRPAIFEQIKHWDKLRFPLLIIILLGVSELSFIIFAPNIHRFWYLWQFGIDMFGYSLWFIYSVVAGKLVSLACKCSKINLNENKNTNMLLSHIIFYSSQHLQYSGYA